QAIAHTLTVPHYRELKGLYHLVPHGDTHWDQFAEKTFQFAHQQGNLETQPRVIPILTSEYTTAARRPLNSRMSNQKFTQAFDLPLQNWERYLELCISSL
ncbi:MAG TPA: sugar nucleotide-binding protein, partial [Pseudobdellovibrionaceae bacterium]|nr:sugar nucleotide-binding protein [Pseudobdellovibrionaceae bacterium]